MNILRGLVGERGIQEETGNKEKQRAGRGGEKGENRKMKKGGGESEGKERKRRKSKGEEEKKKKNFLKKATFIKTYSCIPGILSVLHVFVHLIFTTTQYGW